ncbi:hypothetical protein Vi05172_g10292 [Venturia inaequalis]|nr:hypothetical protein Vi05172_g10292 [Venturia inaequalis]
MRLLTILVIHFYSHPQAKPPAQTAVLGLGYQQPFCQFIVTPADRTPTPPRTFAELTDISNGLAIAGCSWNRIGLGSFRRRSAEGLLLCWRE